MRYYLDTNILIFLKMENLSELSRDIKMLLEDYSTLLYTSTVCVQEFIHLGQIGKLGWHDNLKSDTLDIVGWLNLADIRIMPVTERHLKEFSILPFHSDHRDSNDRLIIAQSISDRIPLISSDRKFSLYRKNGLELIFNER